MERIGETRFKILLIVMANPGVSLRELAARVETSHANVRQHLLCLRREGLVTWGYRRGHKSLKKTLRATCTFLSPSELGIE